MTYRIRRLPLIALLLLCAASLLAGCSPSVRNVLTYRVQRWMGTAPGMTSRSTEPPGTLEGRVLVEGAPQAGVAVVVAEPDGTPHSAVSDAQGRYRIEGLPPGWYVPAAVAPGLGEEAVAGWRGHVASGATVAAPDLVLRPHRAWPLPDGVSLEIRAQSIVTTVYPAGATAQRLDGRFTHGGLAVDTLRLFAALPGRTQAADDAPRPILLLIYPSFVDGWQDVSVGFAAQGYTTVAISPLEARGIDMDAHAQDARVALALARAWCLEEQLCAPDAPVIVLAGSFSSAIAWRLLRDEGEAITAWITVGGIANAFRGAADFHAGRIRLPPWHADAVPALGQPHLRPLPFLRYSPVYAAGELPPTLIIHTAADEVVPLDQAQELEQALRTAGVPVEAFYYADTTHYLQIGPEMTEAGRTMFERVLAFVEEQSRPSTAE